MKFRLLLPKNIFWADANNKFFQTEKLVQMQKKFY